GKLEVSRGGFGRKPFQNRDRGPGGPSRGPRPDRREDDRGPRGPRPDRGERPAAMSHGKPAEPSGPDPDSPFAVLARLKLQQQQS
ncbi:MAG: hypothetical protein AAGC69_14630, partial [Paracraurococcus sp.]